LPDGPQPKNRLAYWSLLLLALILAGGGFLYYTSIQRQLYTRIDDRLKLVAALSDLAPSAVPTRGTAEQSFCERLKKAAAATDNQLQLGIYTANGELICSARQPGQNDTIALPRSIQSLSQKTVKTEVTLRGNGRNLIQPLSRDGDLVGYLVLQHDLKPIRKHFSLVLTVLLLGSIAVLTGFALLQRRLTRSNLMTIRRLTRAMDRAQADIEPAHFRTLKQAGPAARNLAHSYNGLMDRMADSLKRSRQFAANVTHELRTPLTILRGETELALRNGRDAEELRQVLESNLEEINRMAYLIEDLLLLSKTDLGEIPLKMEETDLTDLITELHHQTQILAETKQIKVALQRPQHPVCLHADSLRLRQVLLNLLTNAIKYTPEAGRVEVSLSQTEDQVEIEISDTGIGIDSEHLDKIFNRFYRIDKTDNRHDGGSGLGLAIVKWIVEAHGGTVNVSSVPNRGSTFKVYLPTAENSQQN